MVVSADAGELRRPPGEGAHHDAVIPKPVDFAVLLDIVAAKLGLRWTGLPASAPAEAAAVDTAPAPALRPGQAAQLRDLALIGYVAASAPGWTRWRPRPPGGAGPGRAADFGGAVPA